MPTGAVLGAAAISAGGGIAAASMAGGDGASFAPRDLYREITDTLRAQEETAGRQYALEAEYQPRYQQLNLTGLRGLLKGQEGGERLEYYNDFIPATQVPTGDYVNPATGQKVTAQQYQQMLQGNRSNYQPEMRTEGGYYQSRSRMVPTERSEGLLDLIRDINPEVDALTQESQNRQRQFEADSIAQYGPKYLEALQAANPRQTQLRNTLMDQAEQQLTGELDPFEQRQFQQSFRQAAAGRLGDTGLSGAGAETYYLQSQQERRKREAQQLAQGLIAQDQALYGDPFLQITGRSSGSMPAAQAIIGQGQSVGAGAGPQYFDPFNSYAQDVYSTNANAASAQGIAAGNRQAGLVSGGLGAFGNILGGAMQGGFFNKGTTGKTYQLGTGRSSSSGII